MSKSFVRFIFAAVLCAVLLAVPAFAEEATISGWDVNFRSGPGMNYEVTDCLDKGTPVTVNDRSPSGWYSVTYNGRNGYVYYSYLDIIETAPVVTEQEAPAAAEAAPTGTVSAMYVRFRSGPSTDYSILGEFNTGTPVTILGEADGWTRVSVNGAEGYICSQYINAAAAPAAAEEAPQVQPEQQPQQEQQVQPDAGTGTMPEPPAKENDPFASLQAAAPAVQEQPVQEQPAEQAKVPETVAGSITGDYVRFRSGPGTNYSILGSYNRNQALSFIEAAGDWSKVIINGTEGYVFSQYVSVEVKPAEQQPAEAPAAVQQAAPAQQQAQVTETASSEGFIKGSSVRFRSSAEISDWNILGEYNTGTPLTITGTSGEWTRVVINGKTGYVYSSYVTTAQVKTVSNEGSAQGQAIANFALSLLGCDYVWGGNSPEEGFDCSGFVKYVFNHFGYQTHRVACDIAGDGYHVDPQSIQPGDVLCFYSTDDYIGHVGIYLGNNQFVHASTYTTGVIISDLDTSYYAANYEARRIAG